MVTLVTLNALAALLARYIFSSASFILQNFATVFFLLNFLYFSIPNFSVRSPFIHPFIRFFICQLLHSFFPPIVELFSSSPALLPFTFPSMSSVSSRSSSSSPTSPSSPPSRLLSVKTNGMSVVKAFVDDLALMAEFLPSRFRLPSETRVHDDLNMNGIRIFSPPPHNSYSSALFCLPICR